MDRRTLLCGIAAASIAAAARARTPATAEPLPGRSAYLGMAAELDQNFRSEVVTLWFPRALDTDRGGFHQNFAENWSLIPKGDRASVYQARLTWLSAQAVRRFPKEADTWRRYSNHGLTYLADHLWDAEHGGFFWGLEAEAPYGPERNGEKHVYGHAFGTYAAATVYLTTRNPKALDLARRAFAWLETHAHDETHGGYHESIDREGQPILTPPADDPKARDALGTPFGQKSMNTHIHVLEALSALYEVWPDALLRRRLEEVLGLVRDRIATPDGYLNLFFQRDWTPVPRAVSFGHDVETGFLVVEASTMLGRPEDAPTWKAARALVDRPLRLGFDQTHGGFYDEGDYDGKLTRTDKIWWVQAEGLNALLLLHERYGGETPRYWDAFVRQWAFIRDHQIDRRNHGWYSRVAADGTVTPGLVKSNRWTEGYHQGRALMRISDRLRKLATKT